MGGGIGGSFGNTYGNANGYSHKGDNTDYQKILDAISTALAAASFIPGADTVTNLLSIPVDLLRGDVLSAVLDVLGAIPVAGEIADVAKVIDKVTDAAKVVDKASDAVKTVDKVADSAKIANKLSDTSKAIDKVKDSAKTAKKSNNIKTPSSKTINNPILNSKRVGSATKSDPHHSFNNMIDNYATRGKAFSIKGGDGKARTLYQVKGSLNGKSGIFEWILDKEKGVTHRRFIPGGKITGRPNGR